MALFKIPRGCFVWHIHPGCTLSFIVYWTVRIHSFGKQGINNSRVFKQEVGGYFVWEQKKCSNGTESCWGSGSGQVCKTLRGQSMCGSYDPGLTQTDQRRIEQSLAMHSFCWGMRNSPLICFILFYQAVPPNSVVRVRCVSWVVSQSLPSRSPTLALIRAAVRASVYSTATACVYIGMHLNAVAAQQGEFRRA